MFALRPPTGTRRIGGKASAFIVAGALALSAAGIQSSFAESMPTTGVDALINGTAKSVLRINVGGGTYVDKAGKTWDADRGFSGGPWNGGEVVATTEPISGTTNPTLFQSNRWGFGNYHLPVANGTYNLRLYFAETSPFVKQRLLNVSAEGAPMFSNFDIRASAGGDYRAIAQTMDVTITDGALDLDFTTNHDQTNVSAIELVEASPVASVPAAAVPTAAATTDSAAATAAAPSEQTTTATSVAGDKADPDSIIESGAESVVRINSGGAAFTDSAGRTWEADRGFVGGEVGTTNWRVQGTRNQNLFNTARWRVDGYKLAVPSGSYELRLYLAEIANNIPARSFSVTAEGQPVVSDFNIANAVGRNTATVVRAPVTVSDDSLDLSFIQGSADLTTINGIELVKAGTGTPKVTHHPAPDELISSSAQSVLRVHSGGAAVVDKAGKTWDADHGFVGGEVGKSAEKIWGTETPALFETERWGVTGYHLPVANGTYDLRLYFADFASWVPKRLITVKAEGQTVLWNYDIQGAVGLWNADVQVVPVTITDGSLDLDFTSETAPTHTKVSAIELAVPAAAVAAAVAPQTGVSSAPASTTSTTLPATPVAAVSTTSTSLAKASSNPVATESTNASTTTSTSAPTSPSRKATKSANATPSTTTIESSASASTSTSTEIKADAATHSTNTSASTVSANTVLSSRVAATTTGPINYDASADVKLFGSPTNETASELAHTGIDVEAWTALGFLLLAIGGSLALVGQRARPHASY